jgi:hypothetical protein
VDGQIPPGGVIGYPPNSYAILIPIPTWNIYPFLLAGQRHDFEFPEGVIRPKMEETGNIAGCGILMNPNDKLTIFFTFNGILIGSVLIFSIAYFYLNYYILMPPNKNYFSDRQYPIEPTVDHLFPTAVLWNEMSLEANFGDNPAKPFEYDIKHCPGMGLEWI